MLNKIETELRYSKKPYFFWSFGVPQKTTLDTESKELNIEGSNIEFTYKKFSKWKFLLLKYGIIFLLMAFVVRLNDFGLSLNKILQYIFGAGFVLSIMLLQDLQRQLAIFIIFGIAGGLGLYLQDWWLLAYSIKYSILLSIFVLLVVDYSYNAYSVIRADNKRVVTHFLTLEKI